MPSFVAIDFELANPSYGSICAVGVVRVRAGTIERPRHWLVRPPPPLDFVARRNLELTRIGPLDLVDAVSFEHMGPHLVRNIGDAVLVGHSIRRADLPMFEQSWHAHGLGHFPDFAYVDTLEVAKTLRPDLPGHRLDELAAVLLGDEIDHHRADADAVATAQILLTLLEGSRTTLSQWVRTRRGGPPKLLRPPKRHDDDQAIPAVGQRPVHHTV